VPLLRNLGTLTSWNTFTETVQLQVLLANTLVKLRSQKKNGPLAEQNKHEILKGNPVI